MNQLMNAKAAGFVTAMVLALAPALILFLNDASEEGLITATSAGIAVLIINSIVKIIQLQKTEAEKILPDAPQAAPRQVTRSRSQSMAAQVVTTVESKTESESKVKQFLLG